MDEDQVADISDDILEFRWPKEYFEPDHNSNHPLAIVGSSLSFLRKRSEAGSALSDQKPWEAKISPYARPSYETILATKGSFMVESGLGITDTSKKLCQILLDTEQSVPQNTLFRNDLFKKTCDSVRMRNKDQVFQDISPLICPSAEVLSIYGANHLTHSNEEVDDAKK